MILEIIHNQKPSNCPQKQRYFCSYGEKSELPLSGIKAHVLAVLFWVFGQPNLTEKTKLVPLKITNILLMGKLRKGVMAVAAGLALAGCNEARADDNTKAEVQKVAAVVETTKVTRDQCIALATKAEKIECMKQLKAQRRAEIAAKMDLREENAETIVKIDTDTETEKAEGEKLDTTIEGLSKVVALQEAQPSN